VQIASSHFLPPKKSLFGPFDGARDRLACLVPTEKNAKPEQRSEA